MASRNGKKLSFSVAVPKGAQRFRELIVYISKKCEHDPNFGAVKLNKILYHSDFKAFEKFGVPLTGVTYFRLKAGPAPKPLLVYRNQLLEEGAIEIKRVPLGRLTQERTVALREPILEHFTADEIHIVDTVIDDLWNQSATEVSDASHDVRWKVLSNEVSMPYEFAYLSNDRITERDIRRTRELSDRYGWMAD
jgi:hypothetical protein